MSARKNRATKILRAMIVPTGVSGKHRKLAERTMARLQSSQGRRFSKAERRLIRANRFRLRKR